MNKTLSNLFIFTAGAAVGAVVTWKLVKEKYARIAQEEIDAVREVYAKRNPGQEEPEKTTPTETTGIPEFTERDRIDYANLANTYTNNNSEGGPEIVNKPEIITPGEFGEFGYPTVSLTYYTDGVLEDEFFDVIEPDEIDRMVGADFASHFGEYEDDSVFVRNETTQTDYEILRDPRRYADVPRRIPHPECE